MWKRGGRSSALDRAQALLSAKRTSSGDAVGSTVDFTAKTQGSSGESSKNRPAPLNSDALLSEPSELSLVSERRGENNRFAHPGSKYEEKLDSNKSSLGGGSRFLKRVLSTNNSRSSDNMKQTDEVLEPRFVSSPLSCKQVMGQARQRTGLIADLAVSPPPATQPMRASTEQSQMGKHFLKKKAGVDVCPTVGIRSRAGDPVQRSGGLEKSVRVMRDVNLESDEEDMRKLLEDSMSSSDISFSEARRPSSTTRLDMILGNHSPTVRSTASSAASPSMLSNTATPRSPASPSHRSSPFRFTGQGQGNFSPLVHSPSPSPPLPSPPPPKSPGSSLKAESLLRSQPASSEQGEVHSLEELFLVGPDSEDLRSDTSSVASEGFLFNVMTMDELVPELEGLSAEIPKKQAKPADPDPGSPNQELPKGKEQKEEEEVLDYQSDFERDSNTSQVSDREHEDVPSEVSMEPFDPVVSHKRTEDDHCRALADQILPTTLQSSDLSYRSGSSCRYSRSSSLHNTSDLSEHWRRPASTRKAVKDSASQTQPDPWSAGMGTLDPTVAMIYTSPAQAVTRALAADRVEAISTFEPTVFALNEMVKQQLAVTRRFVDSSHHHYSCLLQSLEPPNYRYTMLEHTIQVIHTERNILICCWFMFHRSLFSIHFLYRLIQLCRGWAGAYPSY